MPFTEQSEIDEINEFADVLVETAVGSASSGELKRDEQATIKRSAEQFRSAIDETVKVIIGHPKEADRLHGLHELRVAISTAFMIGNRAAINPIVERIETDRKKAIDAARAENARRTRDNESNAKDGRIFDCAVPLLQSRPSLRRSAFALATAVVESGGVADLGLGLDAIRKRIARAMKDGRLNSRP